MGNGLRFPVKRFVALDLETTGLDAKKDSILEIGAIKVEGGKEVERFSQIVDPGVPIPPSVVRLTGITPHQIRGMPPVVEVLPHLLRFVEDSPLVAHNLPFDLSFLKGTARRAGLTLPQFTGYDTLQLSRIALPALRNHKLSTLASCYHLPSQGGHRALSDAQVVALLFPLLLADLAHLSPQIISWLIRLSRAGPLYSLFRDLAGWDTSPAKKDTKLFKGFPQQREGRPIRPKKANLEANPVAEVITAAFNHSRFLLVQGVGGKSAWLLPAIDWAEKNSQRVIISAPAKALRDIPFPAKTIFIKGRDNYLCLKRFYTVLAEPDLLLNEREREDILPLVVWADQTRSCDIAENSGFQLFRHLGLWRKLNAGGSFCLGKRCDYYPRCWVTKLRELSQEVKVILVDHSLLCSDLTSDRPLLSPYRYLIAEEADDLERAAARSLGVELDLEELSSFLGTIYKRGKRETGLVPLLLKELKADSSRVVLQNMALALKEAVVEAGRANKDFFAQLSQWILQRVGDQNPTYRVRYGPHWPLRGDPLVDSLAQIGKELVEISTELKGWDKLKAIFEAQAADCEKILAKIDHLLHPEGEDWVWWVEVRGEKQAFRLVSLPIDIAQKLKEDLYKNLSAGVFLSVGGDFSYLAKKLGLNLLERKLAYYTPPRQPSNQILLLPSYLPLPQSGKFSEGVSKLTREIGLRFREGTLVLFPSQRMLQPIYNQLRPWLCKEDINLWAEGFDGPRSKVREAFRASPQSVILATNNPWLGLPVRILILVKLPFPNLREPLVAARMKKLDKEGIDPFQSYLVPETITRLRRTLRAMINSPEKGVVLLLDRRLIDRAYGKLLLKGLPLKPIICNSQEMVMREIEGWLG